jgi:hypothetical protein
VEPLLGCRTRLLSAGEEDGQVRGLGPSKSALSLLDPFALNLILSAVTPALNSFLRIFVRNITNIICDPRSGILLERVGYERLPPEGGAAEEQQGAEEAEGKDGRPHPPQLHNVNVKPIPT